MADASAISWTDSTFNPWIGCAKVSPACAHCYAETLAVNRMGLRDKTAEGGENLSVWGEDAARRITAPATWKNPIRWAKLAREGRLPNGDQNLDGHRPRVFCASMADVFEERPDLEEPRRRLFDLIERTPELDWLILTKRPEFARSWLDAYHSENYFRGIDIPLPNVWMGVSIENQRHAWRAEILRAIPAAVRFISAEPLLGTLFNDGRGRRVVSAGELTLGVVGREPLDLEGISWVIVGGESGGRESRPTHPDWAREIRDACVDAGISFHMKQWGSHAPVRKTDPRDGDLWLYPDGHTEIWQAGDSADRDDIGFFVDGGGSDAYLMRYAGASPKSGGKMLDTVDWCEFPTTKKDVPV